MEEKKVDVKGGVGDVLVEVEEVEEVRSEEASSGGAMAMGER